MNPRDKARQRLERALVRTQRERHQGPIDGPPAPYPRPEEFLAADGFVEGEAEAFAAHLARARFDRELRSARDTERTILGDAITHERQTRSGHQWVGVMTLGQGTSSLAAKLSRAFGPSNGRQTETAHRRTATWYAELRSASVGPHLDSAGALDGASVLSSSDELVRELRERFGVEEAESWPRVLRDDALDAAHPPSRRHRRVAGALEESGLFDALARCVQVGQREGFRSRVNALRPGERVGVSLPSFLHGVSADYSVAHATGRALGYALIDPHLPPALRWPVVGTMPRAMGALLAQTLGHDARRLSRREREQKRQRLAALWVLDLRVTAASVGAPAEPELRIETMSRALGTAARPLSTWLLRPPSARARLRGLCGGLALFVALREHYDEDWYRNPKSGEFLREACRGGGGISVESVVERLGGNMADAPKRLREMLE